MLGGNTFGWTSDQEQSFAVLDAFVEAGGRSIDTADLYLEGPNGNTGGESETILGAWFDARPGVRDRVVLATKVGKWSRRPGLAADNLKAAAEDSLRRLRTDRIDLYYAHADDESVPQEVYLGAFDALVKAGSVGEIGASNFTAERLRSAADIATREGLTSFTVAQDHFNLVERDYATDLAPTVADLGIVQLPYFSLAMGFLTGKYRPGTSVESQRAGGAGGYLDDPANVALLSRLDDVAGAHGVSVTAVSLAWLRQQPTVGPPIASARTPEQLTTLVESFDLVLADDELSTLAG